MSDVTQILSAIEQGDTSAADKLLPLVYQELRKLAAARMANEHVGQTLQATALVHDAYLRLVGKADPGWEGRRHFFFAAARAMRDILVERARSRATLKRGGDRRRVDLAQLACAVEAPPDELLALDEALDALRDEDERSHRVVLLRFFAGVTLDAYHMLADRRRS